jgi:hypothetical protein
MTESRDTQHVNALEQYEQPILGVDAIKEGHSLPSDIKSGDKEDSFEPSTIQDTDKPPAPEEAQSVGHYSINQKASPSVKKMADQIKQEISSIWNGSHPKLVQQRRILLKRQEEKILLAEMWKTYQLNVAEKLYQQEKSVAEREFEAQKNQLREKMIQELLDRKKKWLDEHQETILNALSQQSYSIEEGDSAMFLNSTTDQSQPSNSQVESQPGNNTSSIPSMMTLGSKQVSSNLSATSFGINGNNGMQRKLRRRNQGGVASSENQLLTRSASERSGYGRSKKAPSGPTIVTTLKEYEIDEDLDIIRQRKTPGVATRRAKYLPAYSTNNAISGKTSAESSASNGNILSTTDTEQETGDYVTQGDEQIPTQLERSSSRSNKTSFDTFTSRNNPLHSRKHARIDHGESLQTDEGDDLDHDVGMDDQYDAAKYHDKDDLLEKEVKEDHGRTSRPRGRPRRNGSNQMAKKSTSSKMPKVVKEDQEYDDPDSEDIDDREETLSVVSS